MGEKEAAFFKKMVIDLRNESDRGAVIISASVIEEALELLIKARLIPTSSKDDELFDVPYAPLGTFSAKIDFAYRIGVITADARATFHFVRKTRNDFAHSSQRINFKSHQIQNRVREIFKLNQSILEAMKKSIIDKIVFAEGHALDPKNNDFGTIKYFTETLGYRVLYEILISLAASYLMHSPEDVEPLTPLTENVQ